LLAFLPAHAEGAIFLVSAFPFAWVQEGLGSFARFDSCYLVFIVFFMILRIIGRAGSAPEAAP
jgi:hypothetical protein